ncbi:MAG: PIN domain-containing protein [Scytonema sp. PMC 1069.18]|nr:PIN domain-containing protein [Scytonema sp. PMC 1069.18]MEC4882489.1 PIN domain-containing protein [Scytonema sp. PMC 1070.18]
MSGKFLLDTNIIIALLEGDTLVEQRCEEAEAVFVASTAIGELYYGAKKPGFSHP